ncbi:MAG: FG-GAP repeat protein, partial [Myxococcaceae bacterium]|nr:FG-GAP repeat protein [Myxococcaceae bacterium]
MRRAAAVSFIVLAACGDGHTDPQGARARQPLTVRSFEHSPPAGQGAARFGHALAVLKRPDGGASYAVGAPGQLNGEGVVHVFERIDAVSGEARGGTSFYGSGQGRRPARFGSALASADLDADGLPDLVMGA